MTDNVMMNKEQEVRKMESYRLAICEDEKNVREEIQDLCDSVLRDMCVRGDIAAFASAEELERELDRGRKFDTLILDIHMEGTEMSGMDLARLLRKRGDRTGIIFISGYEEYLLEGYSVQPVHFLLKPVRREKLADALRIDWELNHSAGNVMLYQKDRAIMLSLEEIRYIESSNHQVIVHMEKEEKVFHMSLTGMEQILPGGGQFCRCHHSFLVNVNYVKEFGRMCLYLQDGRRLPVGRKYSKEFQQNFVRYMNR